MLQAVCIKIWVAHGIWPIDSDGCIKQVLIFVILTSSYQFSFRKPFCFNNVLLASPSDAATGFFGRLPGSSFAEDGCHYCSGAPDGPNLRHGLRRSHLAQDSTAPPDLAQEARVRVREFQGSGCIIF